MDTLKRIEVVQKNLLQYPNPSPELRADLIRELCGVLMEQERRIAALESDSARRMHGELQSGQ